MIQSSSMRPLPFLCTAMLVLAGGSVCAEDAVAAPAPAPPVEQAPAPTREEKTLQEWADDEALLTAGRKAVAENHYQQGLAARDASRLSDAIRHLRIAVDYQPTNADYQKALKQVENLAGIGRETRSEHTDNLTDLMTARNQMMWAEIGQRIEEGRTQLVEGAFNQAELSFNQAQLRLETLSFDHPGRAAKTREVESLLAMTQQRRKEQDLVQFNQVIRDAAAEKEEKTQIRLKLEQDQVNNLLHRAQKARERRDYDRCILLCEQVLRMNRTNSIANSLLVKARRERHAYIRQITADLWEEEHQTLWEQIRESMLPQLDVVVYPDDWAQIDAQRSAPSHSISDEDLAWKEEISRKLDQVVTIDFRDLDIADIVSFLQRNTDVNFILDPQVLIDGSVPPITLQLNDVKLSNALDFIMRQTGLRYRLQGEAVFISNVDGLRGDALMKIYDVRDL